jgi:hypothetical protein
MNLYDTPAQAQFINTYVPIQFEGLYKMADNDKKALDDANTKLDETLNEYRSLNTVSSADKQAWKTKGTDRVDKWVNDNIKDNSSLTDRSVQAGLAKLTRELKTDNDLNDLVTSAAYQREFKGKSDPRWNGEEVETARNYNTLQSGVFSETNTPYESWAEKSKPFVDQLKPHYIGTKGMYDYIGITPEEVMSQINNNSVTLATDKGSKMLMNRDFKAGLIPKEYLTTDENGNVNGYDPIKYASARAYSVNSEMATINQEPNSVLLKQWENEQDWAKMKYKIEAERSMMSEKLAAKGAGKGYEYSKSPTYEAYSSLNNNLYSKKLNAVNEMMSVDRVSDGKGGTTFKPGLTTFRLGQDAAKYHNKKVELQKLEYTQNSLMSDPVGNKDKIVDLENKITNARVELPAYEKAAINVFDFYSREAMNGRKSIVNKDQAFNSNIENLKPNMVNEWRTKQYGSKSENVKISPSKTINAWTPSGTSDFTVVDEKTLQPQSARRQVYGDLSYKIQQVLKNNSLVGAKYEPKTTSVLGADGTPIGGGSLYVPISELNSKLGNVVNMDNMNLEKTDPKYIEELRKLKKVGEYIPGEMINKDKFSPDYIRIPVSSKILNFDDSTWKQVDKSFDQEGSNY